MKTRFLKIRSGEKRSWYVGIDFYDWALPAHVASYGRGQFLIAFLCFYISIGWD